MTIISVGLTITCDGCGGDETLTNLSEDVKRSEYNYHATIPAEMIEEALYSMDWLLEKLGDKVFHYCGPECQKKHLDK